MLLFLEIIDGNSNFKEFKMLLERLLLFIQNSCSLGGRHVTCFPAV